MDASKANSRKIVTINGKKVPIKSQKALDLERTWALLCPQLPELLDGGLSAHIWLYYKSQRPDLDESIVLDLLQGRIYSNDRQVREKHVYHGIDKADPRSEVLVQPLEGCPDSSDGGCLLAKINHRR